MFEEMKLKSKKYNIENLYIGYISKLMAEDYENYKWNISQKKAIIFTMKASPSYYGFTEGKDVITNVKYDILHRDVRLINLVGSMVIYEFFPLANLLIDDVKVKGKISKQEIMKIVNYLNKPKSEENQTQDSVLDLILDTISEVKSMLISENDKKYLYDLLCELGKFYISELIKIKLGSSEIQLEPNILQKDLKLDVINRLNIIKSELSKAQFTGNLNLDYQNFSRVLKKTDTRK